MPNARPLLPFDRLAARRGQWPFRVSAQDGEGSQDLGTAHTCYCRRRARPPPVRRGRHRSDPGAEQHGVRRGGICTSRHGRHDQAPPQPLRRRARRWLALGPAVAHRRRARSAGREPAARGDSARLRQPTHDRTDRTGRVVAHQRVTSHRAARPARNRQANAVPGDRASRRIEPRRHPAERVPSLWRPLAAVLQLPAPQARDEAHPDRRQLVPRLPRLRLHPRPLRLRPDAARESIRARAAVPHEPRPLRASGPRVVLVRQPPARRTEHVRRLQARRRAALPHRSRWTGCRS